MHENLLEGLKPKPTPSVQATSMIYSIFAGRMRSQVIPCCSIHLSLCKCATSSEQKEKDQHDENLHGVNLCAAKYSWLEDLTCHVLTIIESVSFFELA